MQELNVARSYTKRVPSVARRTAMVPGVARSHTKQVPSVIQYTMLVPSAGQYTARALDLANQIESASDVQLVPFSLSSTAVSQLYQYSLESHESSIQITMNSSPTRRSNLDSFHQ